ncbi:hypothetical protein GJ695_28735, partial [Pseudoduganella sp. FT9W]|nr:hypothetical protein [Duganella alba]
MATLGAGPQPLHSTAVTAIAVVDRIGMGRNGGCRWRHHRTDARAAVADLCGLFCCLAHFSVRRRWARSSSLHWKIIHHPVHSMHSMPRPSFLPISHALLCAAAAWPCCAAADLSAAVDTAAAAEPHIYCGVPAASAGAALSLAELVAAGMKQNSDTRVAWAQAEEAALNLGVVRSKYGPILAAQAAALHEHAAFPLPKTLNPNGYFKSDAEALVPAVTLKWLLYDGGREAVLDRAGQQLAGANFGFSAAHRRVAIQITQQFFRLSAQTGRQMAAADSLQSALMVEQLAQARQRRGLATAPEALQAGAQAA